VTLDFITSIIIGTIPFIVTIVGVSTPILLAATGELVVEKSGVLNLGVEGMMLIGAITGFALTNATENPWIGLACAAAAGALAASLFGFLVLTLGSNQVATGLALAIFGIGLSSLIGQSYEGVINRPFGSIFPYALVHHPYWKVLLGYSPLVYFTFLMVFATGWFLNRTRAGLVLRAVGENDLSAHSIGYSVIGVRYAAIAYGGALAGVAGAYFSMVTISSWADQLTAGRGWIALALVVFTGWRTSWLVFGAYLFGGLMTLELAAKASGLPIIHILPSQFWASMPYLMAIVVLAVISWLEKGRSQAPACLGKPFLPAT
jgi:general nucleoside transport system permease protein